MARNKYFDLYSANTNEWQLHRDFFTESVQIYGQDVYYVVRTVENEDYLFKEDVLASFDEHYLIEMYLESYSGFEGDDIISKFGFQVTDNMEFSVSVDRFIEETGMTIPQEGDLIYLPKANALFEIKFVEDEDQFYPVGTLPAFKLRCELFRYNSQSFGTGIDEIDSIDSERNLEDGSNIDPFRDNEEIDDESVNVTDKTEDNPFGSY